MLTIKQVIQFLEEKAPPALQESYDNSGLLLGEPDTAVSGIMVSLDVTEEILEEAIQKNCNLIVSHHPLIFSSLKRITGKNSIEKIILKAIRNNIALYAIHTNLDNVAHGVNARLSEKIGLSECRILQPKSSILRMLSVYVPSTFSETLKDGLFSAGAGAIGNYDQCSFSVSGTGTFRPLNGSNPFSGSIGERSHEDEVRIEVIYPEYAERNILQAMRQNHPYEEIAYNIVKTENTLQTTGAGMIGRLQEALSPEKFLEHLKNSLELSVIRYTSFSKSIQNVAVCGGSGSFLLKDAILADADVLITADFKYHQFFEAENRIMIADIGHFESEKYTIELIGQWLSDFFPNFAVIFTETNTNPVNYYV